MMETKKCQTCGAALPQNYLMRFCESCRDAFGRQAKECHRDFLAMERWCLEAQYGRRGADRDRTDERLRRGWAMLRQGDET